MPAISQPDFEQYNVVLLAGGVGGAKLADGLTHILKADRLTIIVNTGDDFQHLGLTICPDLDTVMYRLAGVANPETGWGRADESWRTSEELSRLGGPDWFRLGDLDLATHLMRSHLLQQGETLTSATRQLAAQFGVGPKLLPMCNELAPTFVQTDAGLLAFQTWFVQQRWQPVVQEIHLPEDVRATVPVIRALEEADIILIAPSNPFVSIDPILNVYPIRAMIMDVPQVVVAVTPIIGGSAVKGPLAKMMREMSMPVSAASVAGYYGDLIDGFVFDERDEAEVVTAAAGAEQDPELPGTYVDTLMNDQADRIRLARDTLSFAIGLMDA